MLRSRFSRACVSFESSVPTDMAKSARACAFSLISASLASVPAAAATA